jgi:dihydrofolate synthase/folylpolyglutamate synthase
MTVVTGDLPDEAAAVVRRVAADRGAELVEAGRDVQIDVVLDDGRARLSLRTPVDAYGPLQLALRGGHQVGNALIAVRLLEAARRAGVDVPRHAIERGLTETEWPARLELLALDNGRQVLIDAAHNAEGAQALAAYLKRWHPEPPLLVISVMRDKDVEDILDLLVPVASAVIATQAPSPRAVPAAELAARVRAVQARTGRAAAAADIADPAAAVAAALDRAPVVCIAGSIFLAGAVRDGLKRRAILH